MQWDVYLDVLITSDANVVLLRPEGEELWRLPGGFLTEFVAPSQHVRELAREQVGLSLEDVTLVWAEARREAERPVLMLHFQAEAPDYPAAGPGVAEVWIFQVEHLPPMSDADRSALYITLGGTDSFLAWNM